ncbi:MAG TPA: SAM-dependent methyltransferase [Streptosporangiaceae bacterium]|nr:SAM-dependent methyltransferase [Streptosporangiaceae bacterium]
MTPDALLEPAGVAVLALAERRLREGEPELRVATSLRTEYPADLVAATMNQVELRARARAKFSRAGEMLFTRAGLEQASSEDSASWRARRLSTARDGPITDLCCGIGGDLLALSAPERDVLGIDADPVHAALARHNAQIYGGTPRVRVADAREVDVAGAAVFIDPARRSAGGRHRPGDYAPPLGWCLSLRDRAPLVAIKAAPGIEVASVPAGWEIEFVEVGGELKESVLWWPGGTKRRATMLPGGHSLAGDPAAWPPAEVRDPGPFLLDPSPAITRAGLVAHVAAAVNGWQIDKRIAFLCADEPGPTRFGRWYAVEASLPWHLKNLAAELRARDVGAVDIRRRGLAGDVEHVRRSLRLSGRRRVLLAMTRRQDKPWALLATPLS